METQTPLKETMEQYLVALQEFLTFIFKDEAEVIFDNPRLFYDEMSPLKSKKKLVLISTPTFSYKNTTNTEQVEVELDVEIRFVVSVKAFKSSKVEAKNMSLRAMYHLSSSRLGMERVSLPYNIHSGDDFLEHDIHSLDSELLEFNQSYTVGDSAFENYCRYIETGEKGATNDTPTGS